MTTPDETFAPLAPSRHRSRRWLTLAALVAVWTTTLLTFDAAWATGPASETLAGLRLAFEENRGQFGDDAAYLARSGGFRLLFDDEGATVLARRSGGAPWPLRLRVAGDGSGPAPRAEQPLPGRVNYYLGDDPARWQTGVRTFGLIRYAEVWPGVDLVYRGYGGRVEYDFEVAAGADPGRVELVIEGAERLELSAAGELLARAGDDVFRMAAPVLYQRGDAGIETVAGRFRLAGGNRVRFDVGGYDTARELVIDPVLLGYSTRHGGSDFDEPKDIVVDDAGFIYVTGATKSSDFLGAGAAATGTDTFVTKITPDGQSVLYTTLLGGNDTDQSVGMAVDARGNAYVGGQTQSTMMTFPTLNGYRDTLGGDADYFMVRLNPRGLLAYSTLYGGDGRDGEFDGGVALGPNDIVYLAGRTGSLAGLRTENPYEASCAVSTCAFAAGFDTRATGAASLVYSTYIGGDSDEGAQALDVDANGHLYVFGFTGSDADLIDPAQGFQPASADMNNNDTWLIKLDPAQTGASQLLYSTYMSGPGDEAEFGEVVANDSGIAWVVGATSSLAGPLATDFPNKNARQTQNAGSQDAFLMKIDTTRTGDDSLLFATFLGGSQNEEGASIAVDSSENVYAAISSSSFDFPVVAPLAQFASLSGINAMLVQLDPTAMDIETATPLPGADRLTVDGNDDVYIAGRTQTAVFPLVSPLPPSPVGLSELFLGRVTGRPLSGITLEVADTGDPAAVGEAFAYRYTMTNNGDEPVSGLTLTSDLPAGFAPGFLPAVCFNNGPASIECTPNELPFDRLQPGENLTWFVHGTAAATGDYTIANASVTTTPPDPDVSDNSDGETVTVDASGSTPAGTLRIADFDVFALKFDIGGFAIDTPNGILATSNGSFDEAVNFMKLNGSIPLYVRDIWSQGRVAFGLVDSGIWLPSGGDGGSMFAPEALAHRVFGLIDALGHLEVWSAPPFGDGVLIDEAFVGLAPDKAFAIELVGNTVSVYYDGELVAQGNPYVSGGASQGLVGDDFVVSVGLGNEFLGAALIDSQPPTRSSAGATIPSNPQTCFQQTFNPAPRRNPAAFGWSVFNTGSVSADWDTTDGLELCGGGAVPAGNFTGGSGDAACIDSDVLGPGLVESFLCSPPIDISSSADPDLQFRLNYQIVEPGAEDALEVLVGTETPDASTIAGYESLALYTDNVGVFADIGEVQTLQLEPGAPVHVCFRYAGDHDWYAQIDDVTVSAKLCDGPLYTDSDGDGWDDDVDNCVDDPNLDQRDTDGDGIGNLCDADFDNSCVVGFSDLAVMKENFFQAGDSDTDMDGDGATGFSDLGLLKNSFFEEPGPSGVAQSCATSMCEGTYKCFGDGSIYKIGDKTRIGFWNVETCPGSTSLSDGSDWTLVPGSCTC